MNKKDFIKLFLPGERPWAEVVEVLDDQTCRARIDNKVAGDYTAEEFHDLLNNLIGAERKWDGQDPRRHNFKCDQIVTAQLVGGVWQPVQVN